MNSVVGILLLSVLFRMASRSLVALSPSVDTAVLQVWVCNIYNKEL